MAGPSSCPRLLPVLPKMDHSGPWSCSSASSFHSDGALWHPFTCMEQVYSEAASGKLMVGVVHPGGLGGVAGSRCFLPFILVLVARPDLHVINLFVLDPTLADPCQSSKKVGLTYPVVLRVVE
jgi:hypothetical protein